MAKGEIEVLLRLSHGSGVTAMLPYAGHGCAAAETHVPTPLLVDQHHVFPKYLQMRAFGIADEAALMHDPRFVAEVTPLCASCHESVHYVLERILRNEADLHTHRRSILHLAHRAWELFVLNGGGTLSHQPKEATR